MSTSLAAINLLKMSLVFGLWIFIHVSPSEMIKVYGSEVIEIKSYSSFSMVIVYFIIFSEAFEALILNLINFRHRQSLLDLFNRLSKFSVNERIGKSLRLNFTLTLSFLAFVSVVQYIATMSYSLSSLFAYLFLVYPFWSCMGHRLFIKVFELFLINLLKDLRIRLENCDDKQKSIY